MATDRLSALIDALIDAKIEFVVVGGIAAVLHGAPITTADVDIVHERTEENVDRLLAVLRALHATMRADPRKLQPERSQLLGKGHVLLETDFGPLDVLCEIGDGKDFAWLVDRCEVRRRGEKSVRIVDLPTLIALKTATNRAKDRLAIPVLIATLEERQARER